MSKVCRHTFVWEAAVPSAHDPEENEVECAKCGQTFPEFEAIQYDRVLSEFQYR